MNKIALDTNTLIYLYDSTNEHKRDISDSLIQLQPYIPAQVVSEFLNVSKRLLKIPKLEVLKKCNSVFSRCNLLPTTFTVLQKSETLISKYDVQLFDAIIIATALEGGCNVLYTEDMHHGMIIEESLTLINPFI
jgi:predicted nucleic acid-binding protein